MDLITVVQINGESVANFSDRTDYLDTISIELAFKNDFLWWMLKYLSKEPQSVEGFSCHSLSDFINITNVLFIKIFFRYNFSFKLDFFMYML